MKRDAIQLNGGGHSFKNHETLVEHQSFELEGKELSYNLDQLNAAACVKCIGEHLVSSASFSLV